MPRLCPVCGSADTGGYPKRHKDYTPDRGRLDIDAWTCHACKARWEIWAYVREGVEENHDIRLKDGRAWSVDQGVQGDAPVCPYCKGAAEFVQSDGRWHRGGANLLRYRCPGCWAIWQWIVDDAGTRLFKRLWRQGQSIQIESEQ